MGEMRRIYAPPALREKVAAFVEAHSVDWDVVDEEPCDIRVALCADGDRRQSVADRLEAGGWIKCATAWGLAKKHGIKLAKLGALLDELDIKVRECSLGCFK